MSRLFFGKISRKFPEQLEKNFYAGGPPDSPWYGGIKPGDYVFPIFQGQISKLWKVKEYANRPENHPINPEGGVYFEVVPRDWPRAYRLVREFLRYRYFDLNLTMLNKSVKSTKSCGFFEIPVAPGCPEDPRDINFEDMRSIRIALDNERVKFESRERDIRVLIEDEEDFRIKDIQLYTNGRFEQYEILWKLYQNRNASDVLYSLKELFSYAEEDEAPKKRKFLSTVIGELQTKGYFPVSSPVRLYDHILVGRKRYFPKKDKTNGPEIPVDVVEKEAEEGEELPSGLEDYQEYLELLEKLSPNLILYGPPGTGKTYTAQRIVELAEYNLTKNFRSFSKIQEEGRAELITFHQAFSYEEFVEGIRPDTDNNQDRSGGITYKVEDGILKRIAGRARASQPKPDKFFLIIDEINRGNIARIFGELITLLEKDKREMIKCTLPYSQKTFTLPENLYLIGTMNTADRSIAILDTALRRRFVFKELEPDPEVFNIEEPEIGDLIDLKELLIAVNKKITTQMDRDHRIGHSYFLDIVGLPNFRQVWYYQIIPLLMEYFYNNAQGISEIIGPAFFKDIKTSTVNWDLTDTDFVLAIQKIYRGS